MNPAFLDGMSWEMAEVYGAISDQILINLAKYFPYYKPGATVPKSAFTYQSMMLAQFGQVNAETVAIIRRGLKDANTALGGVLEQAIIDSVRTAEKPLYKAVKQGIFSPPLVPIVSPNQTRAFQLYYAQACDKLNLVNTVMLESTGSAYRQAVNDVVSEMQINDRIKKTQTALDIGAGETATGVSSWNQALRHTVERMKQTGITGFVDHAGRHWSAEAYAAMDIRTTVWNTSRAAVWETNQNFGNDLYSVSFHNGARPLCYDWQNRVISSTNNARTVTDLDGNEIYVVAQSDTSYGQAAGLFGVNCKHYPTPFIPGVSIIRGQPQSPEENERTYAESQEQRRLERKLREEKRDIMMAKAQGASDEEIKALQERARNTSQDIDDFCESTGRTRHRDREGVYTQRSFPPKDSYDVSAFETEQRDKQKQFFENGGAQRQYKAGVMDGNATNTQTPPPTPTPAQPAPVQPTPSAPTPAQTPTVEKTIVEKRAEKIGIERVKVEKLDKPQTEQEIIAKIAGADKTRGSCASVGFAYCGNKCGYDVRDFRGGMSRETFSKYNNIAEIAKYDGVVSYFVKGQNDFTNAETLLSNVLPNKEYFFTAGKHAAIVRRSETGYEYLEMQSGFRENTWYTLDKDALKRRFGCQRSHTTYGMKYDVPECMIDIDSLQGNQQFVNTLDFINTRSGREWKGKGGGEK